MRPTYLCKHERFKKTNDETLVIVPLAHMAANGTPQSAKNHLF